MTVWHYTVPPGLTVRVRAAKQPALLARLLGGETPALEPALTLDLAPAASSGAGVLSVDTTGARTVRGVYKLVPWSCTIASGEERVSLAFHSAIMREYLAFHIAVLPALRRLLLHRGVALMSGAAFALDGEATVLAGMTGSGKTSLLLGALDRGAALVGDEYVGLSDSGEVSPVVRALALREATLGLAPALARRLSARRRLALRAAALATRATSGRLEPLSHVAPADLGLRMESSRAPVRRLFWLEPGDGEPQPMSATDAVRHLATMQAVHDLAYGNIAPFLDVDGCDPGDGESRWRGVIERGLEGAACYRLPVGRGGLAAALERLMAR